MGAPPRPVRAPLACLAPRPGAGADVGGAFLPAGWMRQGGKVRQGSFESLGLRDEVLRAVRERGYRLPTPIQRRSAGALAPSRVTSNTSLPPMRASTPSNTA